MKKVLLGAALAAAMACGWAHGAEAAYIVTINQVENNVVATGSGSIDLSGLKQNGFASSSLGYVFPIGGGIGFGTGSAVFYGPVPASGMFGFGNFKTADFTSGSAVSLLGSSFGVPTSYTGGDLGTSIDIWFNTTLAQLGIASNTRIINEIGADTFTIVTGVPLPSSAPLFGAALLALGGLGYAHRRGREVTAR